MIPAFHWQDITLAVGSFLLDYGVIATIRHRERKPPISTNLLFTLVVASQTIVYLSWGAWLAVITTAVGSIEWFTILIQTVVMARHERENSLQKIGTVYGIPDTE